MILILSFSVIDRRYSPRVQHQTAILGGSAAFKCIVPDAVSKFVRTISWKIKWRSSPRNDFLAVGSSNNRFHALPMSGHLLIERVQALDRDLEVSCTTKNDLNRVALSSASARLFVQGKQLKSHCLFIESYLYLI